MNDETRETMFLASKTNRLTRDKVVTKTIQESFTQEEFKAVMMDKSPTTIFVLPYSSKIPCYYITKRIMPSHDGVELYANNWADKAPVFYSWKEFYDLLVSSGLENVRF
jgi:hypothetical protein